METGDPAQDKMNTHYTAALAQREGYYLSLQTHKLLEIP
jgi:organic radical activating enzyme